MTSMPHPQSLREEIANSVTHGLGALLSLAGLSILVVLAGTRGSASHVVGCSIFGATLVILYTASTLYHAIQRPRAKRVLEQLDHSAIFFLIAGTYTPFTLVSLRGPWGWSLLGTIWGLAVPSTCTTAGASSCSLSEHSKVTVMYSAVWRARSSPR